MLFFIVVEKAPYRGELLRALGALNPETMIMGCDQDIKRHVRLRTYCRHSSSRACPEEGKSSTGYRDT